jgi:hypothetical protein
MVSSEAFAKVGDSGQDPFMDDDRCLFGPDNDRNQLGLNLASGKGSARFGCLDGKLDSPGVHIDDSCLRNQAIVWSRGVPRHVGQTEPDRKNQGQRKYEVRSLMHGRGK